QAYECLRVGRDAVAPFLFSIRILNVNARTKSKVLKSIDELFTRSKEYQKTRSYLDLLDFINRFPRLSPYNAFLIHLQHPGVQFVATAAEWNQTFNRKVNFDARPLVILVPFGPVGLVYDLEDTEGGPLPDTITNPFRTVGTLPQKVYDFTTQNMIRDGIKYVETDYGKGLAGRAVRFYPDLFSVHLNQTLGLTEKYSTLIHELGHIYSGHLGSSREYWWPERDGVVAESREMEAETISFLVCKRMEITTSSEAYLADYVNRHEVMPGISLETILTVAGYIENMGGKLLPPRNSADIKRRNVFKAGDGKKIPPAP
ncbi:MAG: hypothetical protein WBH61_04540, partial [Candidatus Methylomirabilis sp.]